MAQLKPLHCMIAPILALVLGGCQYKEDPERYNELDRLRVLGLASEPADLIPGERATLSALVFEPDDRDVSYAWSWCPVRNGASDGFTCAFEEDELDAIWAGLATDAQLPAYDLGNAETAVFDNVFEPELVVALCQALLEDGEADPVAILGCLKGLEISVEVRVRAGGDEVVAQGSVPLLDADAKERNQNPVIGEDIVVLLDGKGSDLGPGATLEETARYFLEAPIEEAQAESFLPEKMDGLPDPQQSLENLFMSWFMTTGTTSAPKANEGPGDNDDDGDGPRGGGSGSTLFVDGLNEFSSLRELAWELPVTVHEDEARLFLVLRDERGGTGWAEFRFPVAGGGN